MTRSVLSVSSVAIISGGLLFSQQSTQTNAVIGKVQGSVLTPEPKVTLEEKGNQVAMLEVALMPVLKQAPLDLGSLQQKISQDKKEVPVRKISQKKKSQKVRISSPPEPVKNELIEVAGSPPESGDDKSLDLSLNLVVIEHRYAFENHARQRFHAAFEKEELVSNIEMEAHFEGPHVENKERDVTPDGIGFGIKIGL